MKKTTIEAASEQAQRHEEEKVKRRQARTARRRAETCAEILSATREVVLREGIEAFTLDSIARELGMTKQAIYYYFDSKEALLFRVCLEEWQVSALAVFEATSAAPSGADALEALIRTYVGHYATRLEVFTLVTQRLQGSSLRESITPEDLVPVRPLNDLLYGPTEQKLAAEQARGALDSSVHPRRLAVSAHVAAMGLLGLKAMVEQLGDPLRHTDEQMLTELCATFRARCLPSAG
jgi:TetR/AcrR family transcriptional regulator